MNDMVTPVQAGPLGPMSRFFASIPVSDELGAGIQASYGLIGYKGKVWSLRYRGENKPLMRPDNDGPLASIEVVIIKAPSHLSKIYYEAGYVEGSNAPPDCFSTNGITPEPGARKKQNNLCQTCAKNAWGSRVVQQAGRTSSGKACSDSKRLAVVPLANLRNEDLGGPMLLRVPPASLQDIALYSSALSKHGYHYFAVATRISFDVKESYPKFVFQAIRGLTDAEAQIVLDLQGAAIVDRILAETGEGPAEAAEAIPEQAPKSPFEVDQSAQNQAQQAAEATAAKAAEAQAQAQQAAQIKAAQEAEAAKTAEAARVAAAAQVQPQPQSMGNAFAVQTNGAQPAQPAAQPTVQPTATATQPGAAPDQLEGELDRMLAKLMPTS